MTTYQDDITEYQLQSHSNIYQPELYSFYPQSIHPSMSSLVTSQHYPYQNQSFDIHHQCIGTLKCDGSYISSLALAGKFIYTGSSDNEIRLWERSALNSSDNNEYAADNIVAMGKGAVKSLLVVSNILFSAHQDQKIRVWKINHHENEPKKYTKIATLPTLSDRALKILIPKNQVQIRRHKKRTWVHHVDTVSALALSWDESLLYSVSWDRTLKIWQISDFKCLRSIENAHDDAINAVVSSIDGNVYTGSADKKIKVWKQHPGEKNHSLIAILEDNISGVNALALKTDGSMLYSGACDGSLLVWEKDNQGNMTVTGSLEGHTLSIFDLAVVSGLVFSCSADKTIRIWRENNGSYSCLAILRGHQGPVKCLKAVVDQQTPSDTSCLIYSTSLDGEVKVWRIFIPLL